MAGGRPFAVQDPAKDIDKDFLGGEALVQPDARAAKRARRPGNTFARASNQSCHYHNEGTCGDLNVDFVYVFGKLPASGSVKTLDVPLDRKVAYAHTYFHSPAGGEVMLRIKLHGRRRQGLPQWPGPSQSSAARRPRSR